MFSSFSDAYTGTNAYSYCDYKSNMLAFGECGPTGAVSNNAIGSDGTSLLQDYEFSVLDSKNWTDFACTGATFSVNSGMLPAASIDP